MNLVALGLLCTLLGGRPAPKLDPNPPNWARSAFVVGDKAVTVAVPKGHRFELQDPRSRGPIDLAKPKYQLMDAQYEFECSKDDLPQFTVVFSIIRYSAPPLRADIDMSEFAPLYAGSLRATLPPGINLQGRPSSVVTLAGRPWLAFAGQVGITGYATPLSLTHALAIDVWFPSETKHDAAWYAPRLDILKRVAESVVVTDQSP